MYQQENILSAWLAGVVKYTDCISVEEQDNKKTDGEAPVISELFGNVEYPFTAITPRSSLAQSGSA